MEGSFTKYIAATGEVLKAHDIFLTPPANFRSMEHEEALLKAKDAYRAAFVKLTTDKSDAKREIAYGALSADDISQLYKLARKITWPVLGVGTVAGIISEILRGPQASETETEIQSDDVSRALEVLHRRCSELNALCREGLEHVLCTLQLGKYAKPSPIARLFSRKPSVATDDEDAQDYGTDAFIKRFDVGLETFKDQRAMNLEQFYDEEQVKPSRGLFLVLFVEFLLYATAQEIRGLILFTDELRTSGTLTRKRLVLPRVKWIRKSLTKLFGGDGPEAIVGQGYGSDEGDVFSTFTGRVNRNNLEHGN